MDTSLQDQINHMQEVNRLYTHPMSIAILESLKELRRIKPTKDDVNKRLDALKQQKKAEYEKE